LVQNRTGLLSTPVYAVTVDASLDEVVALMEEHQVRRSAGA